MEGTEKDRGTGIRTRWRIRRVLRRAMWRCVRRRSASTAEGSLSTGWRAGRSGAAVPSEFGPQPPKPAAALASGVPDLDGVERALRDAALGGGAEAAAGASWQCPAAAGVRGMRKADAPAFGDGKAVPDPAGADRGSAEVLPLPAVR